MLRVITLFAAFFLWINSAHAQIDLHAHLDMKPGLGILLRGSFSEAPRSTNWKQKIFTRASGVSLAAMNNETRPKLIVVSLYGHPYFAYSFSRDGFHFDRRENVRHGVEEEYQTILKFVGDHSRELAIARNATEARAILKEGKTVIVLSLEGAWATLDSPEDFHRWIDERGLAIVTPVHLTADDLGGNALMNAILSLANSTFDFLKAVNQTHGSCLSSFCQSTENFTEKGNKVVDELMYRNVWLDLAHANELEVADLIKRYTRGVPSSGSVALPLLVTHTQFRDFYPVERGLSPLAIAYIRSHDGIVGLMPSHYMMPSSPKIEGKEGCQSGLELFKTTVAHAAKELQSSDRVTLGSDVNAPVDGLSPGASGCKTSGDPTIPADLREGFYLYSQWNALTRFVAPSSAWADQTLDHFLKLWAQVRP